MPLTPAYIRTNILVSEAMCPHCHILPSDTYLNWFQELRDNCGFALPFKSMYRCPVHNSTIGGSKSSVHLLSADRDGPYGAADIGISKANPRKRMVIVRKALKLGANNLEICDYHLHIGIAPDSHIQSNKLYWGVSK